MDNISNKYASTNNSSECLSPTHESDGASVYLRLRPVGKKSSLYGLSECGTILIAGAAKEGGCSNVTRNQMERHYSFSDILPPTAKQVDVFNLCINKMVEAEENFTVLTYGTSGSGKTYTLLGDSAQPGIVPRSLGNIFTFYGNKVHPYPGIKVIDANAIIMDDDAIKKEMAIRERILDASTDRLEHVTNIHDIIASEHNFVANDSEEIAVFFWVSFVEIYNELVHDLLEPPLCVTAHPTKAERPRKNLKVMSNDGKVFVKGLTSVYVKSSLEALQILEYGLQKVKYASTSINSNSSRSHCIFTVDVIKWLDTEIVSQICYKFCDLAGSERLHKTGNIGGRLKETQRINTSLLTLGRCLYATNTNNRKNSKDVIPFRESKLTMLLQSGLLGKERLVFIVNLTPLDEFHEENLNVLGFASIAKNIIYKQAAVKQNCKRYSLFSANGHSKELGPIEIELEKVLKENIRLQQELQQWTSNFAEEQIAYEGLLRNQLVDHYQKELEKKKLRDEDYLSRKLDVLRQSYELKINSLKRKYEEEYENILEELETDREESLPLELD